MTKLEKIKAGVDYILDQSKSKAKGMDVASKSFTPLNDKAFKKHKQQLEFRVKFCDLVEDLVKDHTLLKDGVLELFKRIDDGQTLKKEDIVGLRKVAERLG